MPVIDNIRVVVIPFESAVTAIGRFFWLIGLSFLRHLVSAVEGSSSEELIVQHEKEEYPRTVATQLQAPRNSTNQQGERANTPPCRWLSVFGCEARALKNARAV